jgi:predicted amidohydrolase YtcJ
MPTNGSFYTGAGGRPRVQAIVIVDGRIAFIAAGRREVLHRAPAGGPCSSRPD